jgi:hypothetical protein
MRFLFIAEALHLQEVFQETVLNRPTKNRQDDDSPTAETAWKSS